MKTLRAFIFGTAFSVIGCASEGDDPAYSIVRPASEGRLDPAANEAENGAELAALEKERRDHALFLETIRDRDMIEAQIIDREGEITGHVLLSDGPHGMVMRFITVTGAVGFHGVHLHQVGDCSDPEAGFKASGGHIGADQAEHGLLNPKGYHVGADFPNVWASETGIRAELFAAGLTFNEAMDEDGFALVIHEKPDDHISQPIGGAGARIACAAFFPQL
ncbi:MAG: superoxide dismutase family protein [Pseudomonadota bacterium]